MSNYLRHMFLRRVFHLTITLVGATLSSAQDHVTPDQFEHTVESDVVYGIDTNYLGLTDTLLLDVYTPIGDQDDQRPLAVLVHGGSWLGGCKDDPNGIVRLAEQLVGRGYVVACVNYRLGWHKSGNVPGPVAGYPPSLWPEQYRAFYALDSAEIIRAIHRGMQDVKGAIRFMKARADQDSVCTDKVFVGGESAGGFIALAVAFMDRAAERPVACGTLPAAPPPDEEVLNITGLNCIERSFTPTGNMLERPDLGSVDGDLNLNGHDARVRGVANFFGGLPSEAFTQDWLQGVDTPLVHLYHQSCDGVVLSGSGQPYTTISTYCNLGATPWHGTYPFMHGSLAIAAYFATLANPPSYITDLTTCPAFDPDLALFECARYADNGSYHYTAGLPQRAQLLAEQWASIASDPSICGSLDLPGILVATIRWFPVPCTDVLYIKGIKDGPVIVTDMLGRCELKRELSNGQVDVKDLYPGSYVLRTANLDGSFRFVVGR